MQLKKKKTKLKPPQTLKFPNQLIILPGNVFLKITFRKCSNTNLDVYSLFISQTNL